MGQLLVGLTPNLTILRPRLLEVDSVFSLHCSVESALCGADWFVVLKF